MDLGVIWGGLTSVVAIAYLWLDGVALGAGVLLPTATRRRDRDGMWAAAARPRPSALGALAIVGVLILGGAPAGVQQIWQGIALPVAGMALALGLRVGMLRMAQPDRYLRLWDGLLCASCSLTCFCQGVLGASVVDVIATGAGQPVVARTGLAAMTPVALLSGVAAVLGYALLAAVWLAVTTNGDLRRRMRYFATALALGFLALVSMLVLMIPVGLEA